MDEEVVPKEPLRQKIRCLCMGCFAKYDVNGNLFKHFRDHPETEAIFIWKGQLDEIPRVIDRMADQERKQK